MRFFTAAALALGLMTAPALAATFTVDVDAKDTPNTGKATGVVLAAGEFFSVDADILDTWSLGAGSIRVGNADGLSGFPAGYTRSGQNFLFGTLIGSVGNSAYFEVGTDFDGFAPEAGELVLYNWDSNTNDNSGFITATITTSPAAVPLPASALLLAGGLGMTAAAGRRKKA